MSYSKDTSKSLLTDLAPQIIHRGEILRRSHHKVIKTKGVLPKLNQATSQNRGLAVSESIHNLA
jgi:hypothetical protein